jgi:hypothetical protein
MMASKYISAHLVIALVTVAGAVQAQQIPYDEALAREFCSGKWTERGVLDDRMFNYCMGQQVDGHAKALDLYDKYTNIEPVGLIDDVVRFALTKWATRREYQMDMVAYEIEQQGEAFLNIAYEISVGNVDQQKLEGCQVRWLLPNEPEWSMVEYCIER